MILVKNKLKKIRKTIDDEDDNMLNYLKYSHLDTSKKTRIDKEDDIQLNNNLELTNIEPTKNHTENKGVDTGNDFETIVPPYVSLMYSEDFDRNEKMVQVWTRMFKENLTTPPPSSSSSSSSSKKSSESFISKNVRRGFRLAEFAYNASVVGFNLAGATLGTAVGIADYFFNNENQQNEDAISVQSSQPQTVHSSPPQTVNSSPPRTIHSSSSSSPPPLVEIKSSSSSSRQTPSSIPAPTSPQSSRASSAKTTPRKKL